MQSEIEYTQPKGKGRPEAPYKLERVAITVQLTNEGKTFKDASQREILFFKYDRATKGYVLDEKARGRLPITKAGRRTAVYKARNELLEAIESLPNRTQNGALPDLVPIALRLEKPLKRGRPKNR